MSILLSMVMLVLGLTTASAQTMVPLLGEEGGSLNAQHVVLANGGGQRSKTVRPSIAVFAGDTVIPQFVDGGSWSTAVTMTNLDTRRLTFRVLFFDDNGRDLIVDVIGQGLVRGMELTLDPLVTLTFQTRGTSSTLAQGWAYIDKGVTDAISGLCVFKQRIPGRPDNEAVVPIVSQFDDEFVLLYDNTGGYSTGAAFANPTSQPVTVPITVRGENAQILDRLTIQLPPFGHIAGSVPVTFPATAGRRGLLEIRTTGFGIGTIGLRFNPTGAFTSFHVLSNINWLLN